MSEREVYRASTTAPVNIAVIKYWGKRDVALNLPTNSSLSVTLDQDDLRAHTTASCSSSYPAGDTLLLNAQPQPIEVNSRTSKCLAALRELRRAVEASDPSLPPLSTYPLRIVSSNNFPTAAGLASSAAGFAALVRAVADVYALPTSPTELSRIARQGSGSACRSLFGGYVAWRMGTRADGGDSLAEQVAPASDWPSMRALILVVSAEKKSVSSTAGMQNTVATSSLFPTRAASIVPARMAAMEAAIRARDFPAFARLTMAESNSFHATCLDTAPPIFYLNDVSRAAIRAVETVNAAAGRPVAAYTFDAGPNAVVYFLEEDRAAATDVFRRALSHLEGWPPGADVPAVAPEEESGKGGVDARALDVLRAGVGRVILTRVGEGPQSTRDHLVDAGGSVVKAS
ncbi:MAG: diphosphomevalonate decarboxylase [Thelocarpon impressellum]|nr:MAG: diphosphomevalonate decarboxylase [Thelocarpon impressellum]